MGNKENLLSKVRMNGQETAPFGPNGSLHAAAAEYATPVPEEVYRPGEKTHLRQSLVYIILVFAVVNLLLLALLWTVASVRGKKDCFCPEVAPPPPCEDGWIWYKNKCYYFSKVFKEWNESRDFCLSHNASLALIDSSEELAFLERFKGASDHWIGLRREAAGKPWLWTNGSLFNNTFPVDGVSSCVFLSRERVSSAACYSDRYWICNKPDKRNYT
ncbi:C-type lectin domain family 2 member B-like [Hyperolius riggenbachi]|uniref:C-type lectin domain family 2 member B-like n=1 Tax=Hyperolius riggenbachi TaxID=752182 RepID=UPI0035A2C7E8